MLHTVYVTHSARHVRIQLTCVIEQLKLTSQFLREIHTKTNQRVHLNFTYLYTEMYLSYSLICTSLHKSIEEIKGNS